MFEGCRIKKKTRAQYFGFKILNENQLLMKKIILFIISALCFVGCKPGTEITGSWRNTDAPSTGLSTILVAALTNRTNARQVLENDLAAALNEKGYRTVKSIEVLPPSLSSGTKPDREALLSSINETGADAILTVALIEKETETRYIPGSVGYAPFPRFGYYGTFWGYYNAWYPMLHDPGYYQEDKVYFIETNLYDVKTGQLLWSAQSETYNPTNLPDFASKFSDIVVSRMEMDDILNTGGGEIAKEPAPGNR